MAITDQFVCPKVRFTFFNGKKHYTVHYSFGLNMWFVFDEDMETDCLAKFEVRPKARRKCDLEQAAYYLDQYFQSINSEYYTV